MEARVREKQIPLRKIDIKNWNSEVARQYGIQRLPTLWLYEDGQLVSQDRSVVFRALS